MQRPSAAKLWQMPQAVEFPMPPGEGERSTPLEVQAASYFAASERIVSFSIKSIWIASYSNIYSYHNAERLFCKGGTKIFSGDLQKKNPLSGGHGIFKERSSYWVSMAFSSSGKGSTCSANVRHSAYSSSDWMRFRTSCMAWEESPPD